MKILVYGAQAEATNHLSSIVMSACPKATLFSCYDQSQALKEAMTKKPDMAFLSVEKKDKETLSIGERLRNLSTSLYLVICSNTPNYALDAFNIHANSYLLNPMSADIRKEAIYLQSIQENARQKIYIQTFGNFDVFLNGNIINFTRNKSKEILAYLTDRKGSEVTAEQLCCVLWEGEGKERSRLKQLYVFIGDLKKDLRSYGIEHILIKTRLGYALNRKEVDCDYYRLLNGEKSIARQYNGDYMSQYSWAEFTNAYLSERLGV